jgi:hypothetical protein
MKRENAEEEIRPSNARSKRTRPPFPVAAHIVELLFYCLLFYCLLSTVYCLLSTDYCLLTTDY